MNQSDTTASFGYWIRRQRMALDLTQAELARQVGCATVTVSKIERDERRPSRQMAKLLADHLAIPEEEWERFLSVAMGDVTVARMSLTDQPAPMHGEVIAAPNYAEQSNLPIPTTPFIGRIAELRQLAQNLEDPNCRLLSLVGPGGFGKTRLAIQVGKIFKERIDLFPDGIFFVALDGVQSPGLVVPAIAAALQITFIEQHDQETLLLNILAKKQLLLILDNAEQILAPELVNKILTEAATVKVVVTSREVMHLQQEWFYPVEGMSIDAAQNGKALADAIDLFDACAQRARPNFALTTELEYVMSICQMVDGVPLAIELAAAWLKVLPCIQIVDELKSSLDILSTTFHNIPERHRNVRAVLEQTWVFLSADEQRVFRQLSVFAGGFQLDAAQHVADASLMMLAAMMEKSILQLGQNGRYRIHALLRQLGAEKLAAMPNELEAIQARQSNFFLRFLQTRNKSIAGRDQKAVLEEVEAEFDNIRVAWSFASEQNHVEKMGDALPALYRYLWNRCRFSDGKHLMIEALNGRNIATTKANNSLVYIRMQVRQAQFMGIMGLHEQALELIEVARKLAERANALPEQALCCYAAGITWWYQYDRDNALKNLNDAYRICTEINDMAGLAQTALNLGYVDMYHAGDYVTGRKHIEEGLQLFRQLEDLSSIAHALNDVSVMDWVAGNYDQAETSYKECIEVARQVGNKQVIAQGIGGLGLVAWGREDWQLALNFLFERLEIMQKIGYDFMVQENLNLLCAVYAYSGQYAESVNLIYSHAHTWRNYFTAEAHIGAGQFNDAMEYLPKETEIQLATKNVILLSSCLLPWTMLLISECPLVWVVNDGKDGVVRLTQAGRKAKAVEILRFLSTYKRCRGDTRQRAVALLNKVEATPKSKSDLAQAASADQTLEEFAREMLSIRLS